MRDPLSYRGARRNALRTSMVKLKDPTTGVERPRKALRFWRLSRYWMDANMKANIVERQKQCRAAVTALAKAIVASPKTFSQHDVNAALATFWKTQKRTRVVHRILVDLGAA